MRLNIRQWLGALYHKSLLNLTEPSLYWNIIEVYDLTLKIYKLNESTGTSF